MAFSVTLAKIIFIGVVSNLLLHNLKTVSKYMNLTGESGREDLRTTNKNCSTETFLKNTF